ncbi:hypothetical protein BH10BAC5_BH10BAC5_09120 [soil metagenome]
MKNFVLVTQLGYIKRSINMNLEGISNEESCISPSSGGSSMNWIMGHLVALTEALNNSAGIKDVISDIKKYDELYDRGKPNVNCDNAIHIREIMEVYNSTHDKLIKHLEENEFDNEENLQIAARLIFHEAYHDGQLGTLRRVLGKDSVIK